MIERYLKLRIHVNNVISNSATQRLKTQKYLLSNEEVRLAEFLIVVLQPFKSITNLLSHSKLSNSRIIPCLVFLKKKLQCNQSDCDDLKEIKLFMLACLNFFIEKYKMFDNVLLITSTFLDPELKNFEFASNLTDKLPSEFISIAQDYLKNKHQELNPNDAFPLEKESQNVKKTTENQNIEDELYSFLNPNIESNPQKRKKSSIDAELKFYSSIKIEKCGFSQFWYINNLKFPRLIKLVRFVCCGPPTTVSSERDFSMGTDIITPKRNKLSDKRIEHLTFLKRNLDREYEF
jgi:hypothetical protein